MLHMVHVMLSSCPLGSLSTASFEPVTSYLQANSTGSLHAACVFHSPIPAYIGV